MKRKVVILIISLFPFNKFRIFLYNFLLKYNISYNSKIGMFNYINCENCNIYNASIGLFNRILCKEIQMDSDSIIGNMNNIKYVRKIRLHKHSTVRSKITIIGSYNYISPFDDVFVFTIGENSLLTNNHYFDCTSNIYIGDNVVFGGKGSEVWTHGFDLKRTMILGDVCLGNNIYLGSGVKILQNVSICNNTIIGAGTIVSKNLKKEGFYVSSSIELKSSLVDYSKEAIDFENGKYLRKNKMSNE